MTGNWLRAAVMGANDGLLSTSSLMMGMAATSQSTHTLLLSGVSALLAGALSMAAGEYVSVSSEKDSFISHLRERESKADLLKENEVNRVKQLYKAKGLSDSLAHSVAYAITEQEPVDNHHEEINHSNPYQAAFASAISFSLGAMIPIATISVSGNHPVGGLWISTVLGLGVLGSSGAKLGDSSIMKGISRVVLWGIASLSITSLLGAA